MRSNFIKTHQLGFSSYTWYQNAARKLIIKAGTEYTSKNPELHLYDKSINNNSPKFAFKHFHNYTADGIRYENKFAKHSHSFLDYYSGHQTMMGLVKYILKVLNINMNKFKLRDFVIHIPFSGGDTHGFLPMEIIGFDEIKNKYLCLEYDPYDGSLSCLNLCNEDELILMKDSNFKDGLDEKYMEFRKNIPLSEINLYSLSLFELNGRNQKLIRKAISSKK